MPKSKRGENSSPNENASNRSTTRPRSTHNSNISSSSSSCFSSRRSSSHDKSGGKHHSYYKAANKHNDFDDQTTEGFSVHTTLQQQQASNIDDNSLFLAYPIEEILYPNSHNYTTEVISPGHVSLRCCEFGKCDDVISSNVIHSRDVIIPSRIVINNSSNFHSIDNNTNTDIYKKNYDNIYSNNLNRPPEDHHIPPEDVIPPDNLSSDHFRRLSSLNESSNDLAQMLCSSSNSSGGIRVGNNDEEEGNHPFVKAPEEKPKSRRRSPRHRNGHVDILKTTDCLYRQLRESKTHGDLPDVLFLSGPKKTSSRKTIRKTTHGDSDYNTKSANDKMALTSPKSSCTRISDDSSRKTHQIQMPRRKKNRPRSRSLSLERRNRMMPRHVSFEDDHYVEVGKEQETSKNVDCIDGKNVNIDSETFSVDGGTDGKDHLKVVGHRSADLELSRTNDQTPKELIGRPKTTRVTNLSEVRVSDTETDPIVKADRFNSETFPNDTGGVPGSVESVIIRYMVPKTNENEINLHSDIDVKEKNIAAATGSPERGTARLTSLSRSSRRSLSIHESSDEDVDTMLSTPDTHLQKRAPSRKQNPKRHHTATDLKSTGGGIVSGSQSESGSAKYRRHAMLTGRTSSCSSSSVSGIVRKSKTSPSVTQLNSNPDSKSNCEYPQLDGDRHRVSETNQHVVGIINSQASPTIQVNHVVRRVTSSLSSKSCSSSRKTNSGDYSAFLKRGKRAAMHEHWNDFYEEFKYKNTLSHIDMSKAGENYDFDHMKNPDTTTVPTSSNKKIQTVAEVSFTPPPAPKLPKGILRKAKPGFVDKQKGPKQTRRASFKEDSTSVPHHNEVIHGRPRAKRAKQRNGGTGILMRFINSVVLKMAVASSSNSSRSNKDVVSDTGSGDNSNGEGETGGRANNSDGATSSRSTPDSRLRYNVAVFVTGILFGLAVMAVVGVVDVDVRGLVMGKVEVVESDTSFFGEWNRLYSKLSHQVSKAKTKEEAALVKVKGVVAKEEDSQRKLLPPSLWTAREMIGYLTESVVERYMEAGKSFYGKWNRFVKVSKPKTKPVSVVHSDTDVPNTHDNTRKSRYKTMNTDNVSGKEKLVSDKSSVKSWDTSSDTSSDKSSDDNDDGVVIETLDEGEQHNEDAYRNDYDNILGDTVDEQQHGYLDNVLERVRTLSEKPIHDPDKCGGSFFSRMFIKDCMTDD